MSEVSRNDMWARAAELKRQELAYQGQNATVMMNQSTVYDGRMRELFSLVAVNFVMNVMTGGIYRFWAKTRLRHYFLSRISFLDDRLIYTGTGKELFIGFLVIFAILVPLFVGFELLKNYAFGKGMPALIAVNVVFYGMFMFLFHAAVYRAQRYRLSRTTWRGIRGGQAGSALIYSLRAMGWSVVVALTAGLAYPLMRANLMGYKINNARFGQQNFRFEGGAGPLFGYWMLPWLSVLVIVGSEIALLAMIGMDNLADGGRNLSDENTAAIGTAVLKWWPAFAAALVLYFLTIFWYRAAEVRHFTGHTTFGELAFESRLKGIKLILPYLAYGLLLSLVIGGMGALAAVGINYFDWGEIESESETLFTLISVGIVILVLGIGSLFKPLIVQHLLIRIFCNNLIIKGKIQSDKLLQSQMQAPRRGEGLADAFDIDGF